MGIFSKFYDIVTTVMNVQTSGVTNVSAEKAKFRVENVEGGIVADKVIVSEGASITIIQQNNELVEELLAREAELLEEANFKLGVIRAQKAELAEMRVLIDEMDTILNRHSEHTGWIGSDLEKQAFKAARG